ncbi:MAG: hypothetical protein K9N10_14095 [Deltaproteobacteria bacterium]|nr:hypothetical protein [Deltaproteobacteria bacterium]
MEEKNDLFDGHQKLTTSNYTAMLTRPLKSMVGSQFLNVEIGGAEKYIYEVCSRLKSRHQMALTYLSPDCLGVPRLSATAFRFMSSGFHHAWRREIRNALRETMPHVVYAHRSVKQLGEAGTLDWSVGALIFLGFLLAAYLAFMTLALQVWISTFLRA